MLKKITIFLMLMLLPVNVSAASTAAKGSVLIEAHTRQILYRDNADIKMGMASTTKIMTALIAIENGSMDDLITVSDNAQRQEGSSIYLRAGEQVKLIDLLYGLMLNSGNDAAAAIAEGIGGDIDGFVEMMNEKAAGMGCKNTHFTNPSGLPDSEHYSTAYDMAIIMSYAMENEVFREIVSTKEYQISMTGSLTYLKNHNKLLWKSPDCIGGKTGFTKANGRCLVSCAKRGEAELIAVTLDDANDWRDHISLYDYGFDKVKMINVIKKNDILCTRRIYGTKVNILSADNFSVYAAGNKNMSCKIHLNEQMPEFIYTGTQLGYAEIFSGKYKVGNIKIISGQDVSKTPNPFKEYMRIMMKNILLRNNSHTI